LITEYVVPEIIYRYDGVNTDIVFEKKETESSCSII
jgi:hypothetical protein